MSGFVIVPDFGDEEETWTEDDDECMHEWVNRPESDTWFCEWCGGEG